MSVQSKNNLPRIGSQIDQELSRAVRETAFEIEAEWKADVRVDTGQYRNSIQTRIEGPTKATVGSPVEHGPPNEFGTRHMAGKPSATTAADRAGKKLENRLRNIERSLR